MKVGNTYLVQNRISDCAPILEVVCLEESKDFYKLRFVESKHITWCRKNEYNVLEDLGNKLQNSVIEEINNLRNKIYINDDKYYFEKVFIPSFKTSPIQEIKITHKY